MSKRTLREFDYCLKLKSGGSCKFKITDLGSLVEWIPGKGQRRFAKNGGDWIRANCVMTRDAVLLSQMLDGYCAKAKPPRVKPAKYVKKPTRRERGVA